MNPRTGLLCLLALGAPRVAPAQPAAIMRAARTITEADVRRRIFLIADDSMGGRNTPSRGLTRTASYIASEFRRFGLKPGGDSGTFLLDYPIVQKKLLAGQSFVRFLQAGSDRSVELGFPKDAAWAGRGLAAGAAKGGVVLVGGQGSLDSLPATELKDRVLVFVTDWRQPTAAGRARTMAGIAGRAGARGLVIMVNSDSAFNAQYGRFADRRFEIAGDREPALFSVAVRESAVVAQVSDAQEQFEQMRSAPGVVAQPTTEWEGEIAVRDTTVAATTAPDVVGILEGSDPVLKNEYVVFSAHMDHIGTAGQPGAQCRPVGTDNVCNGADDDGSGTVGVIELAQAFSRPGARPRRSVIFLTVSGEEHGLWGSQWFVDHPPVPMPQIVADLNADMIGRNWKDTIVAIGKEHSDLGATLNRVNAAHPELHMHAIDDRWPEENFYQRSDHYNFARKGVPILFFFNGVHADYHQATDSPDKIDAEKESRIVRLLFYLGQAVANAPARPRWVAASYKEIVQPE